MRFHSRSRRIRSLARKSWLVRLAPEAAVGTTPPLAAADTVIGDIDSKIVVWFGRVLLPIRLGADAAHADVLVEVGAADAAVAALVHAADALVVDRQLAAVGDGVAARQLDAEPVARARRVADVAPAREVVVRHDGPVVVAVVVQPADAALVHGGLGSPGHGAEGEHGHDGGQGCGNGGGEC
ncbi:hypothetical protein PG995_014536 [Apiospora arundinis]